jgi:hypothetical protein
LAFSFHLFFSLTVSLRHWTTTKHELNHGDTVEAAVEVESGLE